MGIFINLFSQTRLLPHYQLMELFLLDRIGKAISFLVLTSAFFPLFNSFGWKPNEIAMLKAMLINIIISKYQPVNLILAFET